MGHDPIVSSQKLHANPTIGPSLRAPRTAGRSFVRLVRYLLHSLGLLALALVFAAVYAGARTARAALILPFWDQIVAPQMAAAEKPSWADWTDATGLWGPREEPAGETAPADESAITEQVL